MTRTLHSSSWILGSRVASFEREFGRYVGIEHLVGVANGTDALALAFLSLKLPAGSDVLVAATDGGYGAVAARMVGLNPVVMDVSPITFDPTAETARAVLTANTTAIVVTHLHGNAVNLSALDTWRKATGLVLIEDCAQASGLRTGAQNRHVGSTGDAATFSFYPTKNLGGVGDGGAVGFAGAGAQAAASHARSLRQYGWGERFRVTDAGGRNSRLDELQAAILLARLPFLDRRNRRRREVLDLYAQSLSGCPARLLGADTGSVAHHAVVLADSEQSRDRLAGQLNALGIDSTVHYPWLVGDMPGLAASAARCAVAASLVRRILSIPCSAELTHREVDRVRGALTTWARDV